jgi:hypothetical protein
MNCILREIAMWIPFLVWWGFYLFFRYLCPNTEIRNKFNHALDGNNRPKYYPAPLWKHHVTIVFLLSLLWRVIFAFKYSYEAHIYIETVIPVLFAYPFMCSFFTSLRRLAICLLPLTFFVIIEQIKCVQFGQWFYCDDCGIKFIAWGRECGSLLERLLFLGEEMPMIEILFYPAYIVMTVAIAALALSIFTDEWKTPKKSLGFFFPLVFGITTSVMGVCIIWFFIRNQGRTAPVHALAAFASNAMLWIGFVLSETIRKLVRTRLFVIGTVFSIIQTALFEVYHSTLQQHWIYGTENSIASLHPLFNKIFVYPDIPFIRLGGHAGIWPIEEWCAYPAQYIFMGLYIIFFHKVMKVNLIKEKTV